MNKEKHFMVEDDIIANKNIEEASSGAERCMDEIFNREIKEIIKCARFIFISEESSREDLIEIINAQLGFWDEIEECLTKQDHKDS